MNQKRIGYHYEIRARDLINSMKNAVAKRVFGSGAFKSVHEELDGDVRAYFFVSCNECEHSENTICTKEKREPWNESDKPKPCEEFEPSTWLVMKPTRVEVKERKAFPAWIEKAFGQGEIVFLFRPRKPPVVMMEFETFKEMVESQG